MKKAWELYKEKTQEFTESASKELEARPAPAIQNAQETDNIVKQGSSDKPKAKGAAKHPSPSGKAKVSEADKANTKLVRTLAATKNSYHQVVSRHKSLLEALETKSEWAVLRTERNLAELQGLMAEVIGASSSSFAAEALNGDLIQLKKSYNKEDLPRFFFSCRQLQDALAPAVAALEREQGRMHRMFRASQA